MNLYELTGQFLALQNMLEDPDFDEQIVSDTLEALDGEYEEKLQGYGMVLRNLEAKINAIDVEEKRLASRKKTLKNNVDRMKRAAKQSMEVLGKTSVTTDLFKFSIRKGTKKVMIDDESKIPEEFLVIKKDVNKTALKEFLEENGAQKYAHISVGETTLLIK